MQYNGYMVSVRLMTYNHAQFIAAAMDSILMQQTTFPVEVVVGDDFSQDGTLDIVRRYASTDKIHIRILDRKTGDGYWEKRQALGRLYNFADILSQCTGKYIALLDGDDFWTDRLKLQKQVDFLEANPGFVASFHPVKVVDTHGAEIRKSKSSFVHNHDVSGEQLIKGRVMSMLALCFRNVIREFPGEFFKSPTGDNFLCSLLGHYGDGKYLPGIAPSAYRMHNTGVWSLKDDHQKKKTLLLSYFWLWQYYARIEKPAYAQFLYQKILLEGFYSDPFQLAKGPRILGKIELSLIRFIRRFFRMLRKWFVNRK